MRPDAKEKLEILKLEMSLLQGTFDKYDDLIFRNRNWFITIWAGAIGLSFTLDEPRIMFLAMLSGILYWVLEGLMRYQYWYKYVVRYRAIRAWLNESDEASISIYDLTNQHGENPSKWETVKNSFLKLEPSLLALFLVLGAIFGTIFLPSNA